jgi:ribokinase
VTVVVVGSLNVDLVVRAPRLPAPGETLLGTASVTVPGGKGLNQAVASARHGTPTAMVGVVGADAYGDDLLTLATSEGIDVSAIGRAADDGTGVAHITVDDAGANCIVVVPRANRRVDAAHVATAEPLRHARVVLAQLEIPLDGVAAALAAGRAVGAITILNPAPAAPLPSDLLASCDLLVPNETEASRLTGIATDTDDGARTAATALVEAGAHTVVVTLGARGALWVARDGSAGVVRPFPVIARDTTAAGDAFCGVLAAALARAHRLDDALARAAAAGALAATRPGAVPSLPTAEAVAALLAATPS